MAGAAIAQDLRGKILEVAGLSFDGAADYGIELPKDAPSIAIEVGERQLLLKEGPRISTETPANPPGTYRLPLTSSAGSADEGGRR